MPNLNTIIIADQRQSNFENHLKKPDHQETESKGSNVNKLNKNNDRLRNKLTDKEVYEQNDKLNYDQIDIYDLKEKNKLKNKQLIKNKIDNRTHQIEQTNQLNAFELGFINNEDEKRLKEEGFKNYAFNLLISNRIGYRREIPDTRNSKCKSLNYTRLDSLPKTSIIICFYNEAKSTLFRTVQSIIDRTDERLIEEIILVDDFSDSKLK